MRRCVLSIGRYVVLMIFLQLSANRRCSKSWSPSQRGLSSAGDLYSRGTRGRWGSHRLGQHEGERGWTRVTGKRLFCASAKVPIRLAFAKQIKFKLIVALQNSVRGSQCPLPVLLHVEQLQGLGKARAGGKERRVKGNTKQAVREGGAVLR